MPRFREWLETQGPAGATDVPLKAMFANRGWSRDAGAAATLRVPLLQLAAHYLLEAKRGRRAFDPVALQGAWERTNLPRGEGELTFEMAFGTAGKVVLFGNGGYQKLYRRDGNESTAAAGFGYGGRLEVGPFHLGLAGHYGKGLGLNYALEPSDATLDTFGELRKFDGYYGQAQVVAGPVDFFGGAGITRVFLGPNDGPDQNGVVVHSVVKSQLGINGGIVYHWRSFLHLDFDYFRAQFAWFLGEKQAVNAYNAGMTYTW